MNVVKRFFINEPIVAISAILMISSINSNFMLGPIMSFIARKYILKRFNYSPPILLPDSYIISN